MSVCMYVYIYAYRMHVNMHVCMSVCMYVSTFFLFSSAQVYNIHFPISLSAIYELVYQLIYLPRMLSVLMSLEAVTLML